MTFYNSIEEILFNNKNGDFLLSSFQFDNESESVILSVSPDDNPEIEKYFLFNKVENLVCEYPEEEKIDEAFPLQIMDISFNAKNREVILYVDTRIYSFNINELPKCIN